MVFVCGDTGSDLDLLLKEKAWIQICIYQKCWIRIRYIEYQSQCVNRYGIVPVPILHMYGSCTDPQLPPTYNFLTYLKPTVSVLNPYSVPFYHNKFLFRTNISDIGRHPTGPVTAPALVLFLKLNPRFHSADSNLFLRIDSAELLIWVQEQSEEKSPNLTKFTEHFNNMSYWTRTLILNQPDGKVLI